ncbi:recombinase [hydrocarbon metagenome]|uniref:Recombinase n=1 Tax=hydrocarbon metagenome TaxID=938273 RepID=A0A0W8E5S8_9ZZZZ
MPELRAVAYARVSSKEQAEKELSIPAQLKAIRKYCQDKGWKLVGEYLDEGKSAKTADRPAFQKMIAIAKKQNRHFDIIVVHKFDRFSRSREDHVIFKGLLKKHGVLVHSVSEQTDPETPHGFLLEGMLEVISEFYNMNLRNETMKGMTENARRGFHNGGAAPYGYKSKHIVDANGNLKTIWEPDPGEATVVEDIFDMYVNRNMGYKAITYELNKQSIPTRSGNHWSYSTIWYVLHNDAYIGHRTWNKHDYANGGKKKKPKEQWIIVANAHKPLVSRDLYNAVLSKSSAKQNPSVHNNLKKKTKSPFILRGLLLCPDCGTKMVTGSNSIRSRGYTRYYYCGKYQRKGSITCSRNTTPKDKLENAFMAAFIAELTLLCEQGTLEYEIEHQYKQYNSGLLKEIYEIEGGIKYIEKRIALVKSKEAEDKGKLVPGLSELEIEKETMVAQLNDRRRELQDFTLSSEQIQMIRDGVDDTIKRINIEPPDVQKILLEKYIKSIQLDKATNNYQILIIISHPSATELNRPLIERKCYFTNPHKGRGK